MYKYNSRKYSNWRSCVYRRDHFACRLCGSKGGELNAHHIKRKADYPDLAYDKTNGITLCVKCHLIVTGHEYLFSMLLTKIVLNQLTLDYIYSFFAHLVDQHSELVQKLKAAKRWLMIPIELTKQIKSNAIRAKSPGSQTPERRAGRKKAPAQRSLRRSV